MIDVYNNAGTESYGCFKHLKAFAGATSSEYIVCSLVRAAVSSKCRN